MSIGLAVTFLTTFTLFPTLLVLLGSIQTKHWTGPELGPTNVFARLTVDNSSISCFGKDSETYKGLRRTADASSRASRNAFPWSRSWLVNSTIRIPFLAASPTSMMSPIWLYRLRVWPVR